MNIYLLRTRFFFVCIIIALASIVIGGSNQLRSFFPEPQIKSAKASMLDREFGYLKEKVSSLKPISQDILEAKSDEIATSVPVVYYHGVTKEYTPEDVTFDNFKDQMYILKENGYETITLNQFYDFIDNGFPLPEKSFLLAFDDGRRDSYYPVDPILKALDYNAVMYVITETLNDDGPYHLSIDELKEMQSSGRWELESHTRNLHDSYPTTELGNRKHALSHRLWIDSENRLETIEEYAKRITDDFFASKYELKQIFGVESRGLAIPFGDYGQQETNVENASQIVLERAKLMYSHIYYQPWNDPLLRNYPGSKEFKIRRIGVESYYSGKDLLTILENSDDKKLPFEDRFEKDNGWYTTWGFADVKNNILTVSADSETSGSTTVLDGTHKLDNYKTSFEGKLVSGETVSLLARYVEKTYMYCTYSDYGVTVGEFDGKSHRSLAKYNRDLNQMLRSQIKVGIEVNGTNVACLLNDTVVVRSKPKKVIQKVGATGIGVWSTPPGKAKFEAKTVTIDPVYAGTTR